MKTFLKLASIIILIALLAIGYSYLNQEPVKEKTEITSTLVEDYLVSISELSTYEYNYTTVAKFENYTEFYGWKVPFTTSKFIISYDGVIKAGIDMSKVKVLISEDTIRITLPDAKILSHEINYDSLCVLDENQSIFNPIKITEYNSFYKDQAKTMETRAEEKGLLTHAKENAEKIITSYLQNIVGEEYKIVIY